MVGIGNHTGKIKYDEHGIARLDVPRSWSTGSGNTCHLEEGVLSKNLVSILEEDMKYSIFQVFMNPKASTELKKYVRNLEWIKGGKEGRTTYRKAKKGDEYKMAFNSQLKQEYFSVLNDLINLNLEENNFIDFSAVEESTGWGGPGIASLLSPQTYVIKNKGDNVSTFNFCVKTLNDNVAYDILKKKEHPQNYYMSHINILREKKILPLIIGEKKFEFDINTLKNVLNVLIPFRLVHESHDYSGNGDL